MASKLVDLHKKLMTEWSREKTRKLETVDELIKNLNAEFLNMDSLSNVDEAQLTKIQRDLLETEVLYLAVSGDVTGFEELMAKLLQFYDNSANQSEQSPMRSLMLGLYLMCLLAQNQLAKFHMELERISQSVAHTDVYISTPVKLEQYLMQGSYNKVFMTEKNMPSPYYQPFVKILLETVRADIGTCIEKAYQDLKVSDAARLLFFVGPTATQDTMTYGKKRQWKLVGNKYKFWSADEKTSQEAQLDVEGLAKKNIFYAKQLEMIV